MINLNYLFPTPVWDTNISDQIEEAGLSFEELIKTCYIWEKSNQSRNRSNKGINSYQSNDLNFNNNNSITKLFTILNSLIQSIYNSIWEETIQLDNAWININREGSSNVRHIHPGSVLSGIIYLKTPQNSGDIHILQDDQTCFTINTLGTVHTNNPYTTDGISQKPEPGKVVIFPSYIPHRVEENRSKEDRISIAFNYSQNH